MNWLCKDTAKFLKTGFVSDQLFGQKSSNFTCFLPLVFEKCNFFTLMRDICYKLCKYAIILSEIDKIHAFLRLINLI